MRYNRANFDRIPDTFNRDTGLGFNKDALMSIRCIFTPALAILALHAQAQAQVDPAPVKLGGFELIPTLSVDELYDDNITMANDKTAYTKAIKSWVTVVAPELQVGFKTDKSEYNLGYKLVVGHYSSSRDDDYVDHFTNADAAWQLNGRNKVAVRGHYDRAHEDRGSDTSGIIAFALQEPDEYKAETLGATYTFGAETTPGQVVVDIENYDKEYTNHRSGILSTRGRDRTNLKSTGTFYWAVSPATKVLFEAEYTDIDYSLSSSTRDSRLLRGFMGATWDITGKTTGTVKLGFQDRNFNSANREDYDASSWDVEMSWSPKTYSTFTVSTARAPYESAGLGDFIDTEDVTLGWQHGWNKKITSSIYVKSMTENYVDSFNNRDDESINAGVSLAYAIKRWANIRIAYDYSDRNSGVDVFDFDLNSYDYVRNKFTIGVDLSL